MNKDFYCTSAFQATFPGALTFAVPGLTISGVTDRIRNYPPISSVGGRIKQIVLYSGNNDIQNTPTSQFIPLYDALLTAIHQKFPQAKVIMLCVTPRISGNPAYASQIAEVNALIMSKYGNPSTSGYPYVQAFDETPYFMVGGVLDKTAIMDDGLHISDVGYRYLANAIKTAARQFFV